MKRILIALLVMMTIFSLANAQKQTTIVNDSTGNVKVTVTKGKGKDAKVKRRHRCLGRVYQPRPVRLRHSPH